MPDQQPTPTETLLNHLVTLLAQRFIAACGGDIQAARLTAHATIQDYRAETSADLVTVTKIIALGLATISALSVAAMAEADLPILLRLNASATACDRAEHRNRRVLKEAHRAAPPLPQAEPPPVDEADVIARAEAAAALASHALRQPTEPAPRPAAPQQPAAQQPARTQAVPAQPIRDINRATWANAMATVAQEFAAEMPNLPPEEKWAASMRSKALSSVATDLLNGLDVEPYRLKT